MSWIFSKPLILKIHFSFFVFRPPFSTSLNQSGWGGLVRACASSSSSSSPTLSSTSSLCAFPSMSKNGACRELEVAAWDATSSCDVLLFGFIIFISGMKLISLRCTSIIITSIIIKSYSLPFIHHLSIFRSTACQNLSWGFPPATPTSDQLPAETFCGTVPQGLFYSSTLIMYLFNQLWWLRGFCSSMRHYWQQSKDVVFENQLALPRASLGRSAI